MIDKKSEYYVGVSDNIDISLQLKDLLDSDIYLNDKESISKYYEIVDIKDLKWLRINGKGRCTYCHANLDDTCGKKVVLCLNSTHSCYRRKYIK